MKKKLYCKKCEKTYDVELTNIHFVKSLSSNMFYEINGIVNFEGNCFFKELNILRNKGKLNE